MLHPIPPAVQAEMKRLEAIDARDRVDGTPHSQRLRQIPPDSGRLLAILAAGAPAGPIVEIGASAGYSTLWLALAARHSDRRVTTYEILPAKAALASKTFAAAGVDGVVDLVAGDALDHLPGYEEIAFCFLDAEKDVYEACYELVVPRLVAGGLLVADNVLSHQETLQPVVDRALGDERLAAVIVPIGKGFLLGRRLDSPAPAALP